MNPPAAKTRRLAVYVEHPDPGADPRRLAPALGWRAAGVSQGRWFYGTAAVSSGLRKPRAAAALRDGPAVGVSGGRRAAGDDDP